MSSPARSSASATSVGAQGGGGGAGSNSTVGFGEDAFSSSYYFGDPVNPPQDRKDDALVVLKAELMAALDKEVKSLDRDSWMFAGPRSQIHLISRPSKGGLQRKQAKG